MTDVKGLLVMDVDSTLIEEEVIDLLGEHAGFGREIAQITEDAMNGQLDFKEALMKRVALLKGLPVSIFDKVYQDIHFQKGARELVENLHKHSFKVGLVSGGFHETVDRLAKELDIDYVMANRLEVMHGELTGRTIGDVVSKETKLNKLLDWAKENHLYLSQTVAVGDGANDLPMIKAAGVGIAFCAKDLVKREAPFQVNKTDLMEVFSILNDEGMFTND